MSDMIDLRSDTVTLPTAAMMNAMQSAPLGDDVYGEDPTTARLESKARRDHRAQFVIHAGEKSGTLA